MDDDDFHDEIAQLEARSEALTESIERCRKISLAAKLTNLEPEDKPGKKRFGLFG